jgi:hypothetical protein
LWGRSHRGVADSNCQLHLCDGGAHLVPQHNAVAASQSQLLVGAQLHVAHGQQLELGLLLFQKEDAHSHLHSMFPVGSWAMA